MKVIFFIKSIKPIMQHCTFTSMKFLQYTYYFFRSLYYRGGVNTFKLLTYEKKFERQLGISTHSIVNLNNLTLAGEYSDQNHHYQGASYFVLFSIFKKLPPHILHLPFVDYGCGKGRAVFVAEQCGFTNLTGIDIALELVEEANKNKALYRKLNSTSIINFKFCDALNYKIEPNASVFYFFNPFGKEILKTVLQHIKESVKENNREMYCIYLNPKFGEVFIELGFDAFYTKKNKRYVEGIIYSLAK